MFQGLLRKRWRIHVDRQIANKKIISDDICASLGFGSSQQFTAKGRSHCHEIVRII